MALSERPIFAIALAFGVPLIITYGILKISNFESLPYSDHFKGGIYLSLFFFVSGIMFAILGLFFSSTTDFLSVLIILGAAIAVGLLFLIIAMYEEFIKKRWEE